MSTEEERRARDLRTKRITDSIIVDRVLLQVRRDLEEELNEEELREELQEARENIERRIEEDWEEILFTERTISPEEWLAAVARFEEEEEREEPYIEEGREE